MPKTLPEQTVEPIEQSLQLAPALAPPGPKSAARKVAEPGGVYALFRNTIAASGGQEPPPEQFSALLQRSEVAHPANDVPRMRVLGDLQQRFGNRYVQRVVAATAPAQTDAAAYPPVQRQPANAPEADAAAPAPPLALNQGGGEPLDESTRSFMAARFGRNFDDVRIHTDNAAQETAQRLNAEAFTTGRDIYFGRGAYQPTQESGRGLLAHELTHVVQQDQGSVRARRGISSRGDPLEHEAEAARHAVIQGELLPPIGPASPPAIQRADGEGRTAASGSTMPQATAPAPATSPAAIVPASGGEVAADGAPPTDEISLSAAEFSATSAVEAYLEGKRGQEGYVRVAFGTLARGVIKVRKQAQGYDTRTRQSVPLLIPALQPVVNAGVQPVLAVEINRNTINGYITIGTRRGTAGNPTDLLDWVRAHTTEFGWAGIDVTRFPNATNQLTAGTLTLQVEGFRFKLGGWVDGTANFGLINEAMAFSGTATITVPGMQQGAQLEVERNAEGNLYARSEIPVAIANFTGNLIAEYANGTFNIEGTVGYRAEKFSGEVTLLVTDAATARSVALRRLGPDAIAASGEQAAGGAAGEPAARGPRPGPRALAGWGVLNFAITEWMTGTAQVIINNEGHITVIGEIRPPAEVELFAQRDYIKEIFKLEVRTLYGVPLVGNVFLFANIGLEAMAKLGPGKIYNIVLQGTYSTDPAVLQNFSLAASLNISAFAGLRLRAEGGLGVELAGHDIKAGVGLNALAGVRGYVEATPTIDYRETAAPEQGKKGESYIRGHMELAAQPFLGLSGDLFVELDSPWWSPAPDKKWTWPLGSLEYPLPGEFGIGADVNYVIGSPELPEIQFGEVNFDSSKFMTDLMNDHVPQGSTGEQERQGHWEEGAPTGEGAVDPTVAAQGGAPTGEPATGRQQPGDGEPPSPEMMQQWGSGMEALRALAEQSRAHPLSEQEITAALASIKARYGFSDLRASRTGEDWRVHAAMNPAGDVTVEGAPPVPSEAAEGTQRPSWIPDFADDAQVARIVALRQTFSRAGASSYRLQQFRDMIRNSGNTTNLNRVIGNLESGLAERAEERRAEEQTPLSDFGRAAQVPGGEFITNRASAEEGGAARTASQAGMGAHPRHHVFPREMERNTSFFSDRGFTGGQNIDRFTVELEPAEHQAIHGGGIWRLGRTWPGEWNSMIERELTTAESRKGSQLTFREVWTIVTRQMRVYGVPQNFVPYR